MNHDAFSILMVRCFAKGEASNHVPHAQSRQVAPFEASLRDAPQGEVKFGLVNC
jgi:hypothetical protein